jgi:hypothetical protein
VDDSPHLLRFRRGKRHFPSTLAGAAKADRNRPDVEKVTTHLDLIAAMVIPFLAMGLKRDSSKLSMIHSLLWGSFKNSVFPAMQELIAVVPHSPYWIDMSIKCLAADVEFGTQLADLRFRLPQGGHRQTELGGGHLIGPAVIVAAVSDGVFPLITNDRKLSEQALLLAYKGQPVIEKRFEQLKTEFEVAPVVLKEVSRIQAL